MSKSDSYPALPKAGTPEYNLIKELQRLRRSGVSDLAFRPRLYPMLSAIRQAAGRQPDHTMDVLAESKALFNAAFNTLPTANLRQAALILFHLDSESTPPPLQARRQAADKAFAGRNTARHEETVRRTLERDIDRLLVELLPDICLSESVRPRYPIVSVAEGVHGDVGCGSSDPGAPDRASRTTEDDTNRREALKAAAAAAAQVCMQPLGSSREGAWDLSDGLLAALREPTKGFRRMEGEVPSRMLIPAVREHYTLAHSMVSDGAESSPLGYAVLSEIAGLSAWLAWDLTDTAAARNFYVSSVRWAEATGNPLLVGYMMGSLGHFAADNDDAAYGLQLLDQARQHIANRVPAAALAWIESLRAVALAELGDAKAARRAITRAESLASRSSDMSWPFVFVFDNAKAARWRANALSRLGDHEAAIDEFAAVDSSPCAPKQRALGLVQQARSWVCVGDVERACKLAGLALDLGRDYHSERVVACVKAFRRSLRGQIGSTFGLDEQLHALYGRA